MPIDGGKLSHQPSGRSASFLSFSQYAISEGEEI